MSSRIDWHASFHAAIQLDLKAYQDILSFEQEHYLTTKAPRVDTLIIRKASDVPIANSIGRFFRTYNLFEYKSPGDSLSIDDYYRSLAYAHYFKSHGATSNAISIDDITISFVVSRYPRKLINHLQNMRKIPVAKFVSGIYHISENIYPVQLILNEDLPAKEHLYLKSLSKNKQILANTLPDLIKAGHQEPLSGSVMDAIVKANPQLFSSKGGLSMHYCNALRELWADDIQAASQAAKKESEERTLKLTQALFQDNRMSELAKAILDTDFREQLFQEYNL